MSPLTRFALPLHVEEQGEGAECLLLLHGFGTNSLTWNRWVSSLSQRCRVLLLDMKGFGAAPKPRDGRYSPMDQADLVHRLILQKDLTGLTLVGHSMGGGIAVLAALRLLEEEPSRLRRGEPRRLRRLVLVAGAALPQPLSPWIHLAGARGVGPFLLWILPTRWVVRRALKLAYGDPERISGSRVEAYAQPLETAEGRQALIATARQLFPPEVGEAVSRIPRIPVPTLLLWGDQDPIVPLSVGERLKEMIPDARLVVLEGCGHMVQEEKPEESLRVLTDFLARPMSSP